MEYVNGGEVSKFLLVVILLLDMYLCVLKNNYGLTTPSLTPAKKKIK